MRRALICLALAVAVIAGCSKICLQDGDCEETSRGLPRWLDAPVMFYDGGAPDAAADR
jgi:hypothetical protein